MKVLVYSSDDSHASGADSAVRELRRVFGNVFDVQKVTSASLVNDPWPLDTRLVWLPNGDLFEYQQVLTRAVSRIDAFLQAGGCLVAVGEACACFCDAMDTSKHVETSLASQSGQVKGLPRFPGTFTMTGRENQRDIQVVLQDGQLCTVKKSLGSLDTFTGDYKEADCLASYAIRSDLPSDSSMCAQSANSAAVRINAGHGQLFLFGFCPITMQWANNTTEGSPQLNPVLCLLKDKTNWAVFRGVVEHRDAYDSLDNPIRILPVFLVSRSDAQLDLMIAALRHAAKQSEQASIATLAKHPLGTDSASDLSCIRDTLFVKDTHDEYCIFITEPDAVSSLERIRQACKDADYSFYEAEHGPDFHLVRKVLTITRMSVDLAEDSGESEWNLLSPYFQLEDYFRALLRARIALQSRSLPWPKSATRFAIGDVVGYGQVITSTQTMMEKNAAFLRASPVGLTLVATHQVAARGRGQNTWISPLGCLQFSTRFTLPGSAGAKSVFLQYLVALAVVYGLSHALDPCIGDLLQGRIRIKWPNDIYAEVRDDFPGCVRRQIDGTERRFVKIGGILVNAIYTQNQFDLVLGCGVNVLNFQPTSCIQQVVDDFSTSPMKITQEMCAAAIFTALERILSTFEANKYEFTPFSAAYRAAWLHDDQEISLGSEHVRVVGITGDYGLLRTVPIHSNVRSSDSVAWSAKPLAGSFDVQPDGNSFDMLQNLIKPKT
ncbi:hypothetical protein MYAM1_002796 [Malassezia yamatoensis]|uniref:BPL/LPL catalytic domain-containing protein n=1 Tax=Malassezia yamatoensis TaxID=253288 RepID=A0AAJ6CHM8_9BASI|nr:hypothetical protein MYAM1_002796 [Malassezia yamatoensis]